MLEGWPTEKFCLMACAEKDRKAGSVHYTVPATHVVTLERVGNRPLQTFACAKCAEPFEEQDKQTLESFHLMVAEHILRGPRRR